MIEKSKVTTLVSEFLGAGILTLLILSVQRSTIGVPFFVATAAAVTYALMVYFLGTESNGFFNPAVTIALWTVRRLRTATALLFVVVQVLGGWAAYGLYHYFSNASFQPIGGHYSGRVLVAEAIATGIFSFGLASVVYRRTTQAATAVVAGAALMVGMIAASTATLGLLNPAVALGVRAWVPWGKGVAGWATYVLGPVVGAVIGFNLYGLLFTTENTLGWAVPRSAAPAKKGSNRRAKAA